MLKHISSTSFIEAIILVKLDAFHQTWVRVLALLSPHSIVHLQTGIHRWNTLENNILKVEER